MHRIDGPGATIDNKFTEGNPATPTPATTVTGDWLNDVQEELMSILVAAGITPVKGVQNQLLQAIRSANVFQTAAKMDNTTKAATTEFVLAEGDRLSAATGVNISTNTTLTDANRGGVCFVLQNVTVTLPAIGLGNKTGSIINLVAKAAFTLTSGGSTKVWKPGQIDADAATSISIARGQTISVMDNGLAWVVVREGMERERVMGSLQDAATFTGNQTLTADDAGKMWIYGETVAATVTMPAISNTPIGSSFEFLNTGTANLTVQRTGSDQIDNGNNTVNSIVIPPNQSLRLVRASGSSLWHAVTFPAASLDGPFSSQNAVAGWQRLPGGRIEVQGTFTASGTVGAAVAVTFPLGATNCRNLQLTAVGASTTPVQAWFDSPTGTGFNGRCSVASAVVHYRAILD